MGRMGKSMCSYELGMILVGVEGMLLVSASWDPGTLIIKALRSHSNNLCTVITECAVNPTLCELKSTPSSYAVT